MTAMVRLKPPTYPTLSTLYSRDPHFIVAAHQHYLICQILLVAHNPRRPQLGPRRDEAVEAGNVSSPLLVEAVGPILTFPKPNISVPESNSRPREKHMWYSLVKQPLHTGDVHSEYGYCNM